MGYQHDIDSVKSNTDTASEGIINVHYKKYEEAEIMRLIDGLADQYRVDGVVEKSGHPVIGFKNPKGTQWSGSESYEDMTQMRRTGWDEGRKFLEGVRAELPDYTDGLFGKRWDRDVSGEVLDVGLFCAGEPDCWMDEREDEERRRGRVISILVSNASLGGEHQDVYAHFAARVVKMIDALEGVGYRVEVWSAAVSGMASIVGHYYTQVVKVKEADQSVDLDRLAFWLMNAGVHRRIGFAWRVMAKVGFSLDGIKERIAKDRRENGGVVYGGMGYQNDGVGRAVGVLGRALGVDKVFFSKEYLELVNKKDWKGLDAKFAEHARELVREGAAV